MSLARLKETGVYHNTAEEAEELLAELTSKLMQATGKGNLIDSVIAKLESYIKALEAQEKKIYDIFGVGSEAELQALFRDYYSTSGLINLSGKEIEDTILKEYRISVDEKLKEIQKYIDNYFIPKISEDMMHAADKSLPRYATTFNYLLKDTYIKCDLGGSGKVVVTRKAGPVQLKDGEGIKILASELTPVQMKRISELRDYTKQHGLPDNLKTATRISGNSIITTVNSNWYNLTKGRSASEIKESPKKGEVSFQKLGEINRKISNLIASRTKNPNIVSKYILKMLSTDPYIFFVGKNTNKITGILGEIAAITAISELLKKSGKVDPNKIIQWVANHKSNNKELSIDILLRDLAGIQVKNTSKNLEEIPVIDISFAQGNINSILERLSGGQWDEDLLASVLESESFNMPVKRANFLEPYTYRETSTGTLFKGPTPKDWKEFVDAYNLMEKVIVKTKSFLTMYAPDFLYMAAPPTFFSQLANLDKALPGMVTGNNIYMVAGIPHMASSQLINIKKDLKNLLLFKEQNSHFSLQVTLGNIAKKSSIPYDYVAYKNGQVGLGRKGRLSAYNPFSTGV